MSITPRKDFRGRPLGGRAARARRAVASAEPFFWQFLHCLLIGFRVSEEEGKVGSFGDIP